MRAWTYAVGVAMAASLAGCTLFAGEAPSPSPSAPALPPPPAEPVTLDELYGLRTPVEFLPTEESDYGNIDAQIAECMDERGWEYWAYDEDVASPGQLDLTHGGFYIVVNELNERRIETWTDPNHAYSETLTAPEREQWEADLDDPDGCRYSAWEEFDAIYQDPYSSPFGTLAYALQSPHATVAQQENPFSFFVSFDGEAADPSSEVEAFDPREDAVNGDFEACAAAAGYPRAYTPFALQRAIADEFAPELDALLGEARPGDFSDLPKRVRTQVQALVDREARIFAVVEPCEEAWWASMKTFSNEWEFDFIVDQWESMWPDIDRLRREPDAPEWFVARWAAVPLD